MKNRKTTCVHAGNSKKRLLPKIDFSTLSPITNLSDAISDITELNTGGHAQNGSIYSRLHNDTVAQFEIAFANVEGAEASVAFASGMAAITALILDAGQRGAHVLACRPIYGGTDALLSSQLLGTNIQWVTTDEISKNIRPETALIMIETPANPTGSLVDIAKVVSRCEDIPVSVDSTFATPYLQNPLKFGARYAVHSATKFIGGHSDVLAGVIACSEADAKHLRKIRIMTGANLHPLSAYLLQRGLQTLHLRVEAAQANAKIIAANLSRHRSVDRVYYPDEKDPLIGVNAQMRGTGSMIAFELSGGFEQAQKIMQTVDCIVPAVSLGSVESLIQHPAGLTHRNVSKEARKSTGITPGLLRLSVGVEAVEDLWVDLERSLRVSATI